MNNVEIAYDNDAVKFERCVEFLVRMVEKYGNTIYPTTPEEIRRLFPNHQCKRAA